MFLTWTIPDILLRVVMPAFVLFQFVLSPYIFISPIFLFLLSRVRTYGCTCSRTPRSHGHRQQICISIISVSGAFRIVATPKIRIRNQTIEFSWVCLSSLMSGGKLVVWQLWTSAVEQSADKYTTLTAFYLLWHVRKLLQDAVLRLNDDCAVSTVIIFASKLQNPCRNNSLIPSVF